MPERLSEQQLAEIEQVATQDGYIGTLRRELALALLAEVKRLRRIEAAARAMLEHVAHPEEGYEELMALMEAVG